MRRLRAAVLFAILSSQAASPAPNPFVGEWTANMAKSKQNPNYPIESASLQFVVTADALMVTGRLVVAGKAQQHTERFRTDGKGTAASQNPGVMLLGRWVGSRVFETIAKKGGDTIALVTYEVSFDGNTLIARTSGAQSLEQELVFERK